MPAPAQLLKLIERFNRNRDDYRKGKFNETQLRIDYLNPLFELLGWDIANRAGESEEDRDVIHEDHITVDGATKAPDYCFRINGKRKFFLEAKKPSVNIKDDIAPAFQLRRYAWSAKLPLSILSDFEEIAIYDCRINPDRLDRASVARISYFTFDQLADKWEEFSAIFSRDAVLNGSLDAFAKKSKTKRGTEQVDDAFLKEIEGWREMLAKDIAKRNTALTQAELNDAVQRTIDRIIFLRICEDRGIEEYGRLQALKNGTNVYPRLMQLFQQADARYNSGLFHFRREKGESEAPDELTPELQIDDKVLKEIFRRLYYPDSPYEFSVIPASILGQVYEQFLGKVILLDAKHRATVEEKPEVRKAGGVYYTPEYIAEYIVKNTVGKLVEGKTPKEVATLRVLDPACGSGSFLLVAYDFLLSWHRNWYEEHAPEKIAAKKDSPVYSVTVPAAPGETETTTAWRLTTAEKKRILLANIYGVDIDRQAVEVTKLSLLLKMLEGESEQTIGKQLKLMHDRVLPDLGNNIKCGNSLISSDFYDDPANAHLDLAERQRINAFDWNDEFPNIMKQGGFDAVIGNPPYYKVSGTTDPIQMNFFKSKYKSAGFKTDLYALFIEKSVSLLCHSGLQSFIIPNSFLAGVYLKPLRQILAKENTLKDLVFLKDVKVFADAKLDSVVYFFAKLQPTPNSTFVLRTSDASMYSNPDQVHIIRLHEWLQSEGLEFRAIQHKETSNLFKRMSESNFRLSNFATVHLGLVLESNELLSETANANKRDPIVMGRDISRYGVVAPGHWFAYGIDPIVGGTKNKTVYDAGPRIVVQAIRNLKLPRRIIATIVPPGLYTMGTVHNIILRVPEIHVNYVLGILNSRLINEYYSANFPEHRIKGKYLEALPFPATNSGHKDHDKMVMLVEQLLSVHKQLALAKTSQDKTFLARQIEQTDKKIDRLVYELYGLTEEEIAIVEGEG